MTRDTLLKYLTLRIIYKDSVTGPYNLLKAFGFDIEKVFSATFSDLDNLKISKDKISAMLNPPTEKARDLLQYCEEHSIEVIPYVHSKYPKRLRTIFNPPFMLFVKGELPDFDNTLCISIVGTRKASDYGYKSANFFVYQLAKAGAVVISGGALGIDSEAHSAALEAGGKTVAVIGCGIGYNYPVKNRELRNDIANSGAIISEYVPTERPLSYHFPIRNRIISALSQGTLVVEAGISSGALITADLALEQGNDVFAIPGSILELSFEGTNKLIKDGAKPVFSAMDILEEYTRHFGDTLNLEDANKTIGDMLSTWVRKQWNYVPENKPRKKKESSTPKKEVIKENVEPVVLETVSFEPPPLPDGLSKEAETIYSAFSKREMTFDALAETTGLPTQVILSAISELELFSLVTKGLGNSYIINN
ncbi:MAG: DNA-processing protein DprA [Clostridia bacterium]|nr:DNA-processing protein DprA [Clostridia bacterium]